jgi:multifunctional methyltransferase subunit TRM112
LHSAARDLNLLEISEATIPSDIDTISEDILRSIHHALFEVHIIEGNLICPESGRKFPIHEGIPNMILHEDEV